MAEIRVDSTPAPFAAGSREAGLAAQLAWRRRHLTAVLAIPFVIAVAAYIGLAAFGQGLLQTRLGADVTVGWLLVLVMLLLSAPLCGVYARRSRIVLDPLRVEIRRLGALGEGAER